MSQITIKNVYDRYILYNGEEFRVLIIESTNNIKRKLSNNDTLVYNEYIYNYGELINEVKEENNYIYWLKLNKSQIYKDSINYKVKNQDALNLDILMNVDKFKEELSATSDFVDFLAGEVLK